MNAATALLPTAIFLNLLLYCFFYLFRPNVLDYYLPANAPRQINPAPIVKAIAWLHILFGFWLLLPIGVGIALLRWQTKAMWWVLMVELSLLVIMTSLAMFVSTSEPFRVSVELVSFLLSCQGWLYLIRKDVKCFFFQTI